MTYEPSAPMPSATTKSTGDRPRRSRQVEFVRISLPLVILAIGVGGFFAAGSLGRAPERQPEQASVPLVETMSVDSHDDGLDIALDGLVVPFRHVSLSAEVAGRIKNKAAVCRAGNFIAKDTLLLEIDPSDYELEVRRLEQEHQQAKANLNELAVEISNADALISLAKQEEDLHAKNLKRLINLRGQRVVAESESEEGQRKLLVAKNSLQTLRNRKQLLMTSRIRLQAARDLVAVQLDKAQLDLQRTKITAPLDGTIVEAPIEQEAFVQRGTQLVVINDTSAAEIRCNLRMDELYWLWNQESDSPTAANDDGLRVQYQIPKAPVTVSYRLAEREYIWKGVLSRYEGTGLDEKTRTVPCRVLVDQPRNIQVRNLTETSDGLRGPRSLVSGMYVTVKIHSKPRARLVKVPERAIRPGNVVWLVRDGKLDKRRVRVAEIMGSDVVLHATASNLAAGDRVIVSPLTAAEVGMPVREQREE